MKQLKLINTELIKFYMKEKGMTKAEFCKNCKIAVNTFDNIMKNNPDVRMLGLLKIARIMGVHISEMFIN